MSFDVEKIRQDFPILDRRLANDRPLVYLDSANTSQKPQQVLDVLHEHYALHNANVARAAHQLGEESTAAFEGARDKVATFINAPDRNGVIFTKNASEALNLVARVVPLGPGDEVVISEMEHHSNIVPWQQACERTGATLTWWGITDEGRLDYDPSLITERTKIVSVVWVSNALGTVNPVHEIVRRAHEVGALVCVDASQAVPQMAVDVTALDADFVAFTGHKLCGPTGIGVLYGKYDLLAELPPFLGGGEMIEVVRMEGSTYAPPPHRFEAGTPPIAQAVGLGAAIDYLTAIGMDNIAKHEHAITSYALEGLKSVAGVRILGPDVPVDRGGAISFSLADLHPHDVGQILDSLGIAVRGGHHCARPVHARFGVTASTRASFYLYTTVAEIDALVDGLEQVKRYFKVA